MEEIEVISPTIRIPISLPIGQGRWRPGTRTPGMVLHLTGAAWGTTIIGRARIGIGENGKEEKI
jgi:hypothetical protein